MKNIYTRTGAILLRLFICLSVSSLKISYASPLQEKQTEAIKTSFNTIKFERNKGQMSTKVSYGFITTFGSMYLENNKIKLNVFQCDPLSDITSHTVDINFPGGSTDFNIEPSNELSAKYNYWTDNNPLHAITDIPVYGELTIKNVYDGIDLRLYSAENKTVEFDWIVAPGADFSKIKIHFEGHDNLSKNDKNNLIIGLRHHDLEMQIPECYQVIRGQKKKILMDFSFVDSKTIGYNLDALACNNEFDNNYPLIIDPAIVWSSYFDADVDVAPIFDAYCSGLEIVPCTGESYVIGTTNISVPIAYRDSAVGYDDIGPGVNGRKGIIYKIDAAGTTCTDFTYFGNNVTIKSIELFPNGNVIIGGSIDSTCNDGKNCATILGSIPLLNPYSNSGRGWVAVFNSTLNSLLYSTKIPGLSGNFGTRAWGKGGITSISVLDDENYFVGGVCNSNSTVGGTSDSLNFVPSFGVPDPTRSGYEAYVARFSGANYNNKDWATFFGSSGNEDIVDIDITTDKSKIVFCTSTTRASGAPALVNPIDSTRNNQEGLIGVLPSAAAAPSSFLMYSYLGGSGDESGLTLALDSTFFYTYYTTTTSESATNKLPGGLTGTFDTTLDGNSDGAITKALITGGIIGTKSTYIGGSDIDNAGCIAINKNRGELYLFGTTLSSDFPCTNSNPPSVYYDSTLGSSGSYDISIAFLTTDLKLEKYGIYIGGCYNDYLGETGIIHSADHLSYNYSLSRLGLATTIHSADMATFGSNCGTGLTAPLNNNPGTFDPFKTTGKEGDAHFIVLWEPTTTGDFGDVPNVYETTDPAVNHVIQNLRFGDLVEADRNPLSSYMADGDDLFAMTNPCGGGGIPDDEDGIDSIYLPLSMTNADTIFYVPVNFYNNTDSLATIHAWIDLNQDSIFEAKEYTYANVKSIGNNFAILNWNLSSLICGNTFSPGLTYARFRITTQKVKDDILTIIDERSISYQDDGEVEDYPVYINGVDWGDLPNPYPLASAIRFRDNNNDNIPDEIRGVEHPVWLGSKVDIECTAHQNNTATADLYDDGVLLPPQDSVTINEPYTYYVTLNSSQAGKMVYFGMWFDWNYNDNFTDATDLFYADSALVSGPVVIPVNVITPSNLSSLYALRVIVSGVSPLQFSDYGARNKQNGEVEDYIQTTKDFVLKVELVNFNGNFAVNHNHLYWSSASESTGLDYIIQRSTDGISFDDIATVQVIRNSKLINNYLYDDYEINLSYIYYYRLKILENDNTFHYSKNLVIRISDTNIPTATLFPNPVSNGNLQLYFANYNSSDYRVTICNNFGQIVYNTDYKLSENEETITIPTASLSNGIYFITITDTNTQTTILSKEFIVSGQ
jgi:hypothetical protein